MRAAFAIECGSGEGVEPPAGLAKVDPAAFVNAVKIHRVSQRLYEHAAALDLTSDIADAERNLARSETLKAMTLAQETARAWSALAQAGIPAVVLKGVALSVQTTGRLTSRGDGDIDLLVAPGDVREALQVLTAAGWRRQMPTELSDEWWPWYSRVNRETPLPGSRSDVDLHWRITYEPRLLEPTHVILERSECIEIAGEHVQVLKDDDALHATCYAYQLDRFTSLRMSLDVARLVRKRTEPCVTMHRQLRNMVGEAVTVAQQAVGGTTVEQICDLRLIRRSGSNPVRRAFRIAVEAVIEDSAIHKPTTRRSTRVFLVPALLLGSQRSYFFDRLRWASPLRVWARIVLTQQDLRPSSDTKPCVRVLLLSLLKSLPFVFDSRRSVNS